MGVTGQGVFVAPIVAAVAMNFDVVHVVLGVSVRLDGNDIVCRPSVKIPPELNPLIRAYKPEIIDRLRQQAKDRLSQRYEQRYQGEGLIDEELAELERRIEAEGFVLCYIKVLQDYLAFHRDNVDPVTIPVGFIPYSARELQELFDRANLSTNALRLIHAAKVKGANVTGNHADIPLPRLLERLRKGHSWLCAEYQRSFDEPDYNADKFAAGLATWDELERTLRVVHRFEGCVFGEGERCPEDAPVYVIHVY